MAKYYERIKDLERLEASKPPDQRAIDDTGFEFSTLKAHGFVAKLLATLIQQRWFYALLRILFPVIKIGGIYFVTRYKDVKYVRENDQRFEAPYGREMDALTGGGGFLLGMRRGPEYDKQFEWILKGVAGMPPAFQRADLENLVLPRAHAVSKQLLASSGGSFDVIEDYLNRIAVETCCHHYGLEPEDPNAFAQWLMSLSALLFADYNGSEAVRNLAMAGAKRILPVINTGIAQARFCLQSPDQATQRHGAAYCAWITDTVIGRLVAQQIAAPNLGPSDDDIRGMIMGLAVGFVPTGAGGGGGILEVLLQQPSAMKRAIKAAQDDDTETLERILLEAMRFKPPILPGLPRYVVEKSNSAASGGNKRIDKIPAGATILAAAYSAMFDGRQFGGSIKRFDETRDLADDDLSFGGRDLLHYCFGEQIFRKMITVSFQHLLTCENLQPARGKAGKMERTGPFPVHMQMTFETATNTREQSMLTICLPLARDGDVARINRWLDQMGNPAIDQVRNALLNQTRLHFAHMTAIGGQQPDIPPTLLIELNTDGPADDAIAAFVDALWDVELFQDIMATALGLTKVTARKVKRKLRARNYDLKITPWSSGKQTTMGLNFQGLPEQSIEQTEAEQKLAAAARTQLTEYVRTQYERAPSARESVANIRRHLRHTDDVGLSASLVRPSQKNPAVSRRPNLELSQTLALYLKDPGFLLTVLGSVTMFWLIYFAFLRGGIPKHLDWANLGTFAVNAVHVGLVFVLLYGLHWLRLRFFAGASKAAEASLVMVWAGVTTLIYLVVTPLGIWTPGALDIASSPDYWGRIYALGALAWTLGLSAIFGIALWVIAVLGFGWAFLRLLQASEDGSPPEDHDLALNKYQEVMARENQPDHAQNHIVFVTPLKDNPGWLRRVTMFIGFYFIKTLVLYRFRFGFVLDLGTIHFARWFILPGSHTMVFYSNYDGSGESYFEDFVTKARWGQTGVWSNGKGFPETENLLFKGAKDATRFKRWIRHHQCVSRFWFARFKQLSTRDIRRNAMICEGLAKARTDSEYRQLVEIMTSRTRPDTTLETHEIQSMILRGMGNLKAAKMLALKFPKAGAEGDAALSTWLADLSGLSGTPSHLRASFDGRKDPDEPIAVNVALSPSGLQRLKLQDIHHVHEDVASNAFASLPAAFRSGMISADRQQILGDRGHDTWRWGGEETPDAALLIYARDAQQLADIVAPEVARLTGAGFTVLHEIDTKPITENPMREPFGFVDGVSQPILKGSPGAAAPHSAMHVVEPGEFVLGYLDNTDYYPTSPMVNAVAPGAAHLPSASDINLGEYPAFGTAPDTRPKDLGKNGSFLVIRQLEQDVAGFTAHLKAKADQARTDYGLDYVSEEWLGAKIMGRWKNGSSIVRNPHAPRKTYISGPSEDENAFRFGAADPQGQKCPFGAHIRRANPRDSQAPGSDRQIELSNRHRLLRRGRAYADAETGTEGLLFMCLNANLERQFEFVQQTWLNATRFHGLQDEYDSVAGASEQSPNSLTIPTSAGPIKIDHLQSFVTMKGGGYFFLPSRSALRFFSELVVAQTRAVS